MVSIFHFMSEIERQKTNIAKETESLWQESIKLNKSVLKKAVRSLKKSNEYSENTIYQIISTYDRLLHPDGLRDSKAYLFWISEANKKIIDRRGIKNYADHNANFNKINAEVENSFITKQTVSENFYFCKTIKNKDLEVGNICVRQNIKSLIPNELYYRGGYLFKLSADNQSGETTFSVQMVNLLSSYFVFLKDQAIYAVIAYVFMSFAVWHLIITMRRREGQYENSNKAVANKILFLNYYILQTSKSLTHQLESPDAQQYQKLSPKNIECVINYFDEDIAKKNLNVVFTMSVAAKEVKCQVLLLQRLLASLLTESIYVASENTKISIEIDVKKNQWISLVYDDNTYAVESDTIIKQLEKHVFFINKEQFNHLVYNVCGEINESYVAYKSKKLEIKLPIILMKDGHNIIHLPSRDDEHELK